MARIRRVVRRRKTGKKRVVRRRMRKMRVRRSLGSWYPFGKSRTAKLRYCETISFNPASGVAGTYTFSANGLYDPNISGTGHQPYGFDQLMALYNHYTVLGARIKITPINGSANLYYTLGIKLCDTTQLNSSTPDYIMEQPGFRKRVVANNAAVSAPGMSCNFSCKKFFRHRSKALVLANTDLRGSASVNPAEQAYFIIVYQPVVVLQDLPDTTFQVQIDYCATFTGPKELGSS